MRRQWGKALANDFDVGFRVTLKQKAKLANSMRHCLAQCCRQVCLFNDSDEDDFGPVELAPLPAFARRTAGSCIKGRCRDSFCVGGLSSRRRDDDHVKFDQIKYQPLQRQ